MHNPINDYHGFTRRDAPHHARRRRAALNGEARCAARSRGRRFPRCCARPSRAPRDTEAVVDGIAPGRLRRLAGDGRRRGAGAHRGRHRTRRPRLRCGRRTRSSGSSPRWASRPPAACSSRSTRAFAAPRRRTCSRGAAPASCSPCAASSTPTTRRCSTSRASSCRRSSTRSCFRVNPMHRRSAWDDFLTRGRGVTGAELDARVAVDRLRRPERRRVHVGHDREPEGRRDDARPDAARLPRLVRLGRPARRRPLPDRQPVLPHLRLQGRVPRVADARRHDLPARGVRSRGRPRTRRARADHGAAGCADHLPSRCSTIPTARSATSRACGSRSRARPTSRSSSSGASATSCRSNAS